MPTVEEHWDSLKRHDRWTVQSHVVAALASHCAQLSVPPTSSLAHSSDVRMMDAAAATESARSSGGATRASSIRSSGGATDTWTKLVVAEDELLRRKRSLSLVQQPWHEELIELPSRTAKRQCWAEELADAEQAMRQCHVEAPAVPPPSRVPYATATTRDHERPPMPMRPASAGRGRGRVGVLMARGRAPHLSRLRGGGARAGRGFGRGASEMPVGG